jgi:hypothetical protein
LTDVQLLACLDGPTDPDVQAHLEHCPYCRQRADGLANFQARMNTQLYRITCLSSHELGEYHLGLLSAAQQEVVRRHLAECPYCSKELVQLQDYLSQLAPDIEFSLLERVRVLVAQVVKGDEQTDSLRPLVMVPAGVGLRGEQEGLTVYQAERIQITLEVQLDPQSPGSRVLLGMIMGAEAGGWKLDLWRENQVVGTGLVDNLGNWVVSGLAPGLYELIFSGPDLEIHIQSVSI